MLVALIRLSAPLPPTLARSCSPRLSYYPQHVYSRTFVTITTTAMFKAAVKNHTAATAHTAPVASKQQSLTNTSARPLSTLSGNAVKQRHVGMTEGKAPAQTLGIKRTSSGLAKVLGSQEEFDFVDSDWENQFSNMGGQELHDVQVPVQFDEGDFDSDLDLDNDVGDVFTGATVSTTCTKPSTQSTYQKLPENPPTASQHAPSSQPIPWSSSPQSHFQSPLRIAKNPPRVPEKTAPQVPDKTKRRTLPWLQRGPAGQDTVDEELEEMDTEPLRKRRSIETTPAVESTPVTKPKSEYPWNTTQSAIKEQQKNLREANKKINRGTDEDVKAAIAKKKKNSVHRIFLSEEQTHVLNLVTEYKKSVFFTGSAGTGKSVLLREIITALRKKYIREPDRIAVTASTGLAACNIGGVTLHSFAGIGLGKEPAEDLVKKIRRNAKAKQRWMRTKVLIIDEVSMVDGELFDKLEQIARTIRNNGRPFGGMQLIITGDFFQLPPVPESGRVAKFAFDAGTWTTSIEHTIGLHHVFRQKDPVFANMLNEMREGRLTADSIAKFHSLSRPLPPSEDNIEATELFPTRSEVDRANQIRMNQLSGQVYTFESKDGGTITDKERRDKLLQSCMVPEQIHLKKGAQVMLVKNMDETLVNGSLGKVFGFMTEQLFAYYKENEEEFLEGNSPELDALKAIKEKTLGVSTATLYPVVRFAIADGTTRDILLKRESWKIELPNGEVQASRDQIPLILAWALSIHKAQGQTLERVTVDLGKVFEKGQAYVALSRATSMAGLQVKRFNASKVIAHEKVRAFYSGLSRAEHIQEKEKDNTILGKMKKAKRKGGDE